MKIGPFEFTIYDNLKSTSIDLDNTNNLVSDYYEAEIEWPQEILDFVAQEYPEEEFDIYFAANSLDIVRAVTRAQAAINWLELHLTIPVSITCYGKSWLWFIHDFYHGWYDCDGDTFIRVSNHTELTRIVQQIIFADKAGQPLNLTEIAAYCTLANIGMKEDLLAELQSIVNWPQYYIAEGLELDDIFNFCKSPTYLLLFGQEINNLLARIPQVKEPAQGSWLYWF